MNEKYVLAIDQSTQGTKAILFDERRNLVCRCDILHKQHINEKGWVSHDLDEIYQNTLQAVKDLVAKAQISKEDIACIGISNQRETSAAWNKRSGEALAQAVVWQCARAKDICERVRQNGDAAQIIQQKTGMYLAPYFPASKYAWLMENMESVKQAAKYGELCLGTIDTWLLFKLTKGAVYATDYSNASRTQLFNIHTLTWDKEICALFGIDSTILPRVCDSAHKFGETDLEGYLDAPVPICGLIGDSQGALLGQGCIEKGMVKATYGTGSSVMMQTGNTLIMSELGLVTSLAWGLDGKASYVLEGNINYTGAVITWLKDDLQIIDSPSESEALASAANQKDTAYLVPAFSGLGAPYWKTDARAVLCQMGRTTGKKEVVKAALESIAYQISDVVQMMKTENGGRLEVLCADGGPTNNSYLMQFQSDILNIPVNLPKCGECSALGAAMLAGLAYGMYQEEELFSETARKKFYPQMEQAERDARRAGWKKALSMV